MNLKRSTEPRSDLPEHTITGMHSFAWVEMGRKAQAVDNVFICLEQALSDRDRNVLLLAKYLCKIQNARADSNDF